MEVIVMNKIKNNFKKLVNKVKIRYKEISILRYIKTNVLFISYVLINLVNSWLLRIVTMGNLFSFKAMISDLAFILVFGAFAYLLKPKKQFKVLMPLTIVMTLVCIVNAIYYEHYISFSSFSPFAFLFAVLTAVSLPEAFAPGEAIRVVSPFRRRSSENPL